MKVIDVIDELNINHKVEEIGIRINGKNGVNQELMTKMVNNYRNVCDIQVFDWLDSVDTNIHDQIK